MSEVQTLDALDLQDKKAASVELPAEIFDIPTSIPFIHQVAVAQPTAARRGTHATKMRGVVSGDGKKPFRQKGTGSARRGSIRAPHFIGGDIVHGPQLHDYGQRTPKKMKQGALRSTLSDHARNDRIHVVMALTEGETLEAKIVLVTLCAIIEDRQALVVLEHNDKTTTLSLYSVPEAHVLWVDQSNTYDVLDADDIASTQAALESFLGTRKETK